MTVDETRSATQQKHNRFDDFVQLCKTVQRNVRQQRTGFGRIAPVLAAHCGQHHRRIDTVHSDASTVGAQLQCEAFRERIERRLGGRIDGMRLDGHLGGQRGDVHDATAGDEQRCDQLANVEHALEVDVEGAAGWDERNFRLICDN